MAFGGVATGIMKAQELAIAVAKRRPSGLVFSVSAAAAMSGIIVAASAVFEVTSVAKVTSVATPAIIVISLVPARSAACAPIRDAAPVD